MKKRIRSMLCALSLVLALFPVTAGAADTTEVTLYAGKSYNFSNSDMEYYSSYYVETGAFGGKTYDCVRYNRNNEEVSSFKNDTEMFFVASGAHTIVTVGAADTEGISLLETGKLVHTEERLK